MHAKAAGWEGHASSVVALMAHGSERQLECQCGGEVPTAALFRALNSKAAPALVGKPKIFLVQACRTGERPLLADGPTAAGAMAAAAAADAAPSAAAPQLSDEHQAQLAEEQGLLPLPEAREESLIVVQQHQMGEKQMSGHL